jgi:hypothetical protein
MPSRFGDMVLWIIAGTMALFVSVCLGALLWHFGPMVIGVF